MITTFKIDDLNDSLVPPKSTNIKKLAIIFAVILAVLGVLVLATWKKDFNPADLQAIMSKRLELTRFCSSSKPDFALIEKTYQKGPYKITRWVDDKFKIKMDLKIQDSLKSGKSGMIPPINAQIIDLTISRVLWEYFVYHAENSADVDNLERARIAGASLLRHVEDADRNSHLDEKLIYDAKTQLSTNFQQDVSGHLIKIFETGFLLDMLNEMNRAEENEKNLQAFLFHTARALQFFNILYMKVSQASRENAVFINGELRKKPEDTNLNEIRSRLKMIFSDLPYMNPDYFIYPPKTVSMNPPVPPL